MGAVGKARYRARIAARKLMRTARPSIRRAELVGPPEIWAMKRRFQIDFLTSRGLRPEHRLLDVGCGVLRGGIPLIEYLQSGHYAGIEARAHVLEEGRKELAKAGLEHKRPLLLNASDPAQIELPDRFDYVWAHSVLYHMPDEVVDGYLGLIAGCLSDGGQFYANVKLRARERPDGQPAHSWQGFPVVGRSREFYERAAAAYGLAVEDVGTLESLGDQSKGGAKEMMMRFTKAPR